MWIRESNRVWHAAAGFAFALLFGLGAALSAGAAMEFKDCQSDPANAGRPPWEWGWWRFDWLDFAATALGGLAGAAVRAGIALAACAAFA